MFTDKDRKELEWAFKYSLSRNSETIEEKNSVRRLGYHALLTEVFNPSNVGMDSDLLESMLYVTIMDSLNIPSDVFKYARAIGGNDQSFKHIKGLVYMTTGEKGLEFTKAKHSYDSVLKNMAQQKDKENSIEQYYRLAKKKINEFIKARPEAMKTLPWDNGNAISAVCLYIYRKFFISFAEEQNKCSNCSGSELSECIKNVKINALEKTLKAIKNTVHKCETNSCKSKYKEQIDLYKSKLQELK